MGSHEQFHRFSQSNHSTQSNHSPGAKQAQHHQQRQSAGDAQQRREFLWRERVKLELHVQTLLAHMACLQQEGQLLSERKAAMRQRRPELSAQILLSGFARMRHLPAERLYQYERERLMQEEVRVQQALMQCQQDLLALHGQIEVLHLELSLLS